MEQMHTSVPLERLISLVCGQVNHMFPDGDNVESGELALAAKVALQRLEYCFSFIDNKYFFDGRKSQFNHLHGDQYAIWLYMLSNELYIQGGRDATCSKIYLLNKALHGCDIFYQIELPEIFLLVHPLGTVLGRGQYQNFLMVYQRCGVGSNHDIYPNLGEFTTLRPGSSVLGDCTLGEQCVLAADSMLIDKNLPDKSVYFGNPMSSRTRPNLVKEKIWRT